MSRAGRVFATEEKEGLANSDTGGLRRVYKARKRLSRGREQSGAWECSMGWHGPVESQLKTLSNSKAMAGQVAGVVAVATSTLAVVSCILFVPLLWAKMAEIEAGVKVDLETFKTMEDDIWQNIAAKKTGRPRPAQRQKRQFGPGGSCQCDAQNSCPAGPPGPPGDRGQDGEEGLNGSNGERGLPGNFPAVEVTPDGRCRVCPGGNRGEPGRPGAPGQPGNKGPSGNAGRPGNGGRPGPDGPPGRPGEGGRPGNDGAPGSAGQPGTRGGKGNGGRPGNDGAPGEKGRPGQPGRNGNAGRPGAPGAQGPPGAPGFPGQDSQDGQPGQGGPPGEDAQYCPCPRRALFKAKKQ